MVFVTLAKRNKLTHYFEMGKTLLSFGHGYSAQALGRTLVAQGWTVYGTTRRREKINDLKSLGVIPIVLGEDDLTNPLRTATHLLCSVAPDREGDPILRQFGNEIRALSDGIEWAGYLSTTGVYGDHGGGWVDEQTPLTPSTERGKMRVLAENQWKSIASLPLHIFRLAGIYGPGRGPFEKVRNGTARRIIKPGQVFSRTHVEDIAQVLAASIARPNPGSAYNICDDDPAPPQDVLSYAAELLGVAAPPEVDFAVAELSPMARSFYAENKRVSNEKIKSELGVRLFYPTYREGLESLMASGDF